jgi:tetratricopeptide (TPR) repeat protein
VPWIFAILLIVGLSIAGAVGGVFLAEQFRAQPETPQPAFVESKPAENEPQGPKPSVSARSKRADAFNTKGLHLARAGDIEGAISELRRAVAADPRNFEAHNNLGVLYKKKGLISQALSEYEAANKSHPRHPVPYKNIGILHDEQSALTNAVWNYTRYLELAPNAPDGETIRQRIRDVKDALNKKSAE